MEKKLFFSLSGKKIRPQKLKTFGGVAFYKRYVY